MTTWWRRNRWGVIGLPFALVAALVASSDRVSSYYWHEGLHDPQQAEPGEWLEYRDVLFDGAGEHPLEVAIHLDGTATTTQPWDSEIPFELPDGARAIRVDLTLRAAPDMILRGCFLALRGSDGTRYDYANDAAGSLQPSSPCVPQLTPGPSPSLGAIDADLSPDGSEARPETWSVAPVVIVPEDADITEVLVWWQQPAYAVLPLD
jgi:hypothetical protein